MVLIAGFVVLLVLGAGLFCWTLAFFKLVLGQPLVEWSPRRPVPWAIVDLAGMVALYLVAAVLLRELGWLPQRVEHNKLDLAESKTLTLMSSVLSLAILGVGLPLIALRTRSTLADFGWSARELLADVRLGAIAFVMLAPPVYAIQAAVTQIWPSKHPLMEMFRESPDPTLFAVLFFAAVVVAPLAEELLFRVLLQGFLEKALTHGRPLYELFLGSPRHIGLPRSGPPSPDGSLAEPYAAVPLPRPTTADPWTPYMSPAMPPMPPEHDAAPADQLLVTRAPSGVAAILPIAISSLIFALLHNWPDVIALIPLAVGMGYLYHRTHRLVPCLTVHALLNGLSMAGLWITVIESPKV